MKSAHICTNPNKSKNHSKSDKIPLNLVKKYKIQQNPTKSKNQKTSVVNKYGQSHQIKNLFIVDSSVFVTAGAVNPVATAQAITLFACNYIRENASNISNKL